MSIHKCLQVPERASHLPGLEVQLVPNGLTWELGTPCCFLWKSSKFCALSPDPVVVFVVACFEAESN